MALSIHDNLLISYEVRCDVRTIVLRTEYRVKGKPIECQLHVSVYPVRKSISCNRGDHLPQSDQLESRKLIEHSDCGRPRDSA